MSTTTRTTRSGLFATKPIDRLVDETQEKETELRRAVGALDLTALGLGAIIGTGIFVIIGEAITTSGPSIMLAFLIAGVTCAFSALAFAELASSRVPFVPVFPLIGTALCVYLMADLPGITWLRFLIWMAIGLVIYFAYGMRHSRLRRGEVRNPDAELEG